MTINTPAGRRGTVSEPPGGRVANATAEQGARIATNAMAYPLFGYDLQNTIQWGIPNLTPQDTPQQRIQEMKNWEGRLTQKHIDYVYILALTGRTDTAQVSEGERYDAIFRWASNRPDVFIPMFQSGRELLYRLASSSHVMADDGR